MKMKNYITLINKTYYFRARLPKHVVDVLARKELISKRYRKNIIIDGEETVELDYRALYPRMLYHLAVMLRLIDQGMPVLPVHDSFIVPSSSEEALRKTMVDCYHDKLG